MFKELKVIKLIVIVGLLLGILIKMDFSDSFILELYTKESSFYSGEKVEVFASTNSFFSNKREVQVTDLFGQHLLEFGIDIEKKPISENPIQDGFNFTKSGEFHLPREVSSGIYLIDNQYPIVISSNEISDITIVYPYFNNILYYPNNGRTAFTVNNKSVSLNRTAVIDSFTIGLAPFFKEISKKYKVNYISDVDLQSRDKLKKSKLLILYGKLTCFTPKMRKILSEFISDGGNVLLATSFIANNVVWYKKHINNILLFDDTSETIKSWLKYNDNPPNKILGVNYTYGGNSDDSTYIIGYDNHPLLKGIKNNFISVKGGIYNSPPIKWFDDLPRIDMKQLGFYKGQIIAYGNSSYSGKNNIKGIFVLKPDSSSGTIISLGTEDWCLKKNYQENKDLQIITNNAVDFLLQ